MGLKAEGCEPPRPPRQNSRHSAQHPAQHADWRADLGRDRSLGVDLALSGALAECDERERDALALAPKILPRLLPELWGSEKAAEHWIAKNPQRLIEV
jgi:hypothetical protein